MVWEVGQQSFAWARRVGWMVNLQSVVVVGGELQEGLRAIDCGSEKW